MDIFLTEPEYGMAKRSVRNMWIAVMMMISSVMSDCRGEWVYAESRMAGRGTDIKLDDENNMEIEYNCHVEYGLPEFTGYAYIPVIEKK